MKRELQTKMFSDIYDSFSDYRRFIMENPYIEIVSVINDETSVVVTFYE